MCIRDRLRELLEAGTVMMPGAFNALSAKMIERGGFDALYPVSYTHLRAHETVLDIVCRLLLEKINQAPIHTTLHLSLTQLPSQHTIHL